jgi:galactose mutarotase-like enzyme
MENTFEEIVILSGTTRAKIAPGRGGLVTSLSIDDTETIYLDRETFNDITKNVRGGIPLLFPNAGSLKGGLYNLPQHGFARRMPWNIIGRSQNTITLELPPNQETRGNYLFDFELKLKVEVANNKLTHALNIKNMGDRPMPTAYGIHPYFGIPQEEKQKLITNIGSFNPREINWMEEFDKPFVNPGLISVQMLRKEITIESDSSIFKFVRIWHQPGKNFICIEPWTRGDFALNNPNQSLWIKPNECITLSVIICAKISR